MSFLWYWPAGGWNFDAWKNRPDWTPTQSEQSGNKEPISLVTDGMTLAQWQFELAKWRKVSDQVLGTPSDAPPANFRWEMLGATYRTDKYTMQRVRYTLTDDEWGYAWLLLPHERRFKNAAVLALHQTAVDGKGEVVGLDRVPEKAPGNYYGHELAEHGFVVLAPDAIAFGERQSGHRNTKYHSADEFFAAQPHWSVMGKMAFDTSRAVDLLQRLPDVQAKRIGCVGHSHGAYGTLFAMAADARIDAGVMSCGVSMLRDDPSPDRWWRKTALIPRLGFFEGNIEQSPIDFHIWLAMIAPRPVLVIGGTADTIFPNQAALPGRIEMVKKVYALYGAGDQLDSFVFDGPHQFHPTGKERGYKLLEKALTS